MRTLLLGCAVIALLPGVARAAEATEESGEPIIVTGKHDGYRATETSTALRTATPLIDTPQSITVVTRERLDDQAQRSMAEVLRYVPGATVGQGEGNRDQITLRGQNSSADFFLDGLRDDVQYFRNLYNLERVEVLKGPAALSFGRGGAGGIINRVQKTPLQGRNAIGGGLGAGTLGGWDANVDANAALGEKAAVRVNGFAEHIGSHRQFVDGDRWAVNPQASAFLGRWQIDLSYEHVHDDRVPDRGVPSVATAAGQPNTPLRGFRDTFFGVPGVNRTGLDADIGRARVSGDLGGGLTFSGTVLYGEYDKYYANVYANGPVTGRANGAGGTVAFASYRDATQRQNLLAQAALVWKGRTGAIGHTLLLGAEYGDQDTASQRSNGNSGRVNLATTIAFPAITFGALVRNTFSTVQTRSVYVQDQLELGPVQVVGGVRYDRFSIAGTDIFDNNRPFARTDEKVSPRFGLILKPRANISIYGSYSRTFVPRAGDQFLSLSTTTQNLEPEGFASYEIGAKWDLRPDFGLTLAVFQLDRSNATTPTPGNPLTTTNIGTTRTRGVELGVTGRVTKAWQLSGGYTYQDAALRDDSSVRLSQVPKHQFALWNRYDFNRSVGAGLGVIHQSSMFAAIRTSATTTRVPAWTRVDAALYLKATEKLELQVNVENLLNTTYFPDAQNVDNISTGAPINARVTARLKF